jgi:hypothetical protein
MNESRKQVPAWLVERLARGELSHERAAEVRAELARAGRDEAALRQDLAQADAEILGAHPPAVVAREIARRRHATPKAESARRLVMLGTPLLAGACALLLLLTSAENDPGVGSVAVDVRAFHDQHDTTILKGHRPHLTIYRKTGNVAERLRAESRVRAGDVLQIGYVSARRPFGAIVSVDATGAVTRHLPRDGAGHAVSLDTEREQRLPHSFELDAQPGFERFVFVTAARSFSLDHVMPWLRDGTTALPEGLDTWEITLHKEIM